MAQLRLFQERALPDLGRNIKCGNSLIGTDLYHSQQLPVLSEDERYRVNVFNWQEEFPDILRAGGFDAIIGNPPWISLSGKFGNDIYSKAEVNYLIRKFDGNTYMPNIYEYFVSQGLNLTRETGYFSFIVPDRLGFNRQFVKLRGRILTETQILVLLYKVPFPDVTVDTLIFVLRKQKMTRNTFVHVSEYGKPSIQRSQTDLLDTIKVYGVPSPQDHSARGGAYAKI